MLQDTVALFDMDSQEIFCRIIDRNLKVGISMDNFLDVVGGREEKFEVALAENLSKVEAGNRILPKVLCWQRLRQNWK